jgi:hypothetical protein
VEKEIMEDHKFIRQATNPGAVINTDKKGLLEYKLKKAQATTISNQNSRINNVEKRMENIESMLIEILNRLKE